MGDEKDGSGRKRPKAAGLTHGHRPDAGRASPLVRTESAAKAPADSDLTDSAARVSTGMGAFSDGEFQGGAPGKRGYGQGANMPGGLGQGSGYAQSSGMGGYGQAAPEQGGGGQSGTEQHSDERYTRFDESGAQRDSQYGYGGRGTEQPDDTEGGTTQDQATADAQETTAREAGGEDDVAAPEKRRSRPARKHGA